MAQRARRMRAQWLNVLALGLVGITACTRPAAPTASGEGGWLAGTVDEKFNTVAKQLRGFDMAMVETAYRYTELHWAAQDANWEYAEYQVQKIRTAVENGLERRPRRAKSAETFLTIVLPAVLDRPARTGIRAAKRVTEVKGPPLASHVQCRNAKIEIDAMMSKQPLDE